jgi:hypothetical protein
MTVGMASNDKPQLGTTDDSWLGLTNNDLWLLTRFRDFIGIRGFSLFLTPFCSS